MIQQSKSNSLKYGKGKECIQAATSQEKAVSKLNWKEWYHCSSRNKMVAL